jgi:hypothetical protein
MLCATVCARAQTTALASDSRDVNAARARAVRWLLAQQSEDGGWHSATYGQMRCGAANSALVLYALSYLPKDANRDSLPHIRRGYSFVLSNQHDDGFARGPDGCSDFPNYATALTLASLERLGGDDWRPRRARMRQYLLASQQTLSTPSRRAFGGWSHTGGKDRDLLSPADEDISVTAASLEALNRIGAMNGASRTAALEFLAQCQNWRDSPEVDGGFCFRPIPDDPLNKAGWHTRDGMPVRGRSYASATADGLCALVDCGLDLDDPRVQAAVRWLRGHEAVDHVPGIPQEDAEVQMRDALVYYYFAALARAVERIPEAISQGHRRAVVTRLQSMQRPDGSWSNRCSLMREDDPLVATPLALIALSILGGPAPAGDAQ